MPPSNQTVVPVDGANQQQQTNGRPKEQMKLEQPTTSVVVPPDGGWGWVVMVASFCCNLIVDGIVMGAGSFQEDIAKEFGASNSAVALVCSLLGGFYLIAGPFVSAMSNKWGFRPVTIAGGIISATAFGLSYFATGVVYLYIVYGIIGGIGFSMIYIPSVLTVGYYFEKWRALATGISMCGSGVGTMIFPPFNAYLIGKLGWRSALLVQGVIILLCPLLAILFRPLKPVQVTIEDADEANAAAEKERMLPVVFTKQLPEGRYAFSVPNSSHTTWIGANSNSHYPTAAEVFRGSNANLERRPSGTPNGTNGDAKHHGGVLNSTNMKKLEQLSKAQRRSSGQSTPEETAHAPPVFPPHKELLTVGEAEEDENEGETLIAGNGGANGDSELKPVLLSERRHTVSGRRPVLPHRPGGSRRGTIIDNRPMYRDDIFFSGSLVRIPKYQSQSSLGYHMSVTRLPTQNDVEEDENPACNICPEAVRRTLATMLDMSLLKSPSFMLLAVSGFLTMMGFFIPFLFMETRAKAGGMDEGIAKFTVSAIGLSNTLSRVLCGVISSFNVNALHLNNLTITVGGLLTIFSGYSLSVGYQFTYAAVFGVAIGMTDICIYAPCMISNPYLWVLV